jgi:tetratricopeptide (TPR) repeat protein
MRSIRSFAAILGLLVPGLVLAQEDPHAACAAPPISIPAGLLERPVPLRKGIGNSHELVTTGSPDAQAYYDQGLNYLESYVWIEAARSFHHALRLDPQLAMAHVGLSRVHSGLEDFAGARRFLEKAQAQASNASDRERRRIEIRERQLAAMEDLTDVAKFQLFKRSIEQALAADLDDPQLWLLRANAEEPTAAGRGQRGTAASVAFYERVLELVPNHVSAHHHLVHSYETIGRIDKALVHGEIYARLAPSIPHATHMWGHDLRRVGRVDEAIAQFLKTDALERAYYDAEGIEARLDWHHKHNLDLLAASYQYKGQMKLAEKLQREATALSPSDAYGAFSLRELPNFFINRARYGEAFEAATALTKTAHPQSRAVGHALAGQALLGLGRARQATEALQRARDALAQVPMVTPGIVPSRAAVEPWVTALHGELLLRNGRTEEGSTVLKGVQQAMRATPGADAWIQALFRLESMARSAREVGDWELAEHTARQMLEHDAGYGGSHHALALALRKKRDVIGAGKEFAAARLLWRDADPDLAELKRLPRAN